MAKNRYLPYGYIIQNGKTVVESQEAEIIRRIYREYAMGLSYKKIAQILTEDGICYLPGKPVWNKNMVARILQNEKYGGSEKYPAILDMDQRQAAQTMRKPYTHTESADIKALKPLLVCGLCGEQLRRRLKTSGVERWYCPSDVKHISVALTDETLLKDIELLQHHLAENSEQAGALGTGPLQIDISMVRLQNEIGHALSCPEPDLPQIRQSILALAAQKYACTQEADEDGAVLAEKITDLAGTGLKAQVLKSITAQIKVTYSHATALVLKNGQIIQPPAAGKGAQSHE